MSGYVWISLIMTVAFLAVGFAVIHYNSSRQRSLEWVALAAWIAFMCSAASAIAAGLMIVLHYS